MAKKGKQQRLPQMEDPVIQEIQDAAVVYAGYRDERQELSKKEKETKDALTAVMHKNNKSRYFCQGIEVKRVVEKETIKVRIHKTKPVEE
jgi:hypothetical protein